MLCVLCLCSTERPSTPTAPPLSASRALDAAAVLLQRLLRGRAAQNRLYAAKTAQLQLVRELTAEPVAPSGQQEGVVVAGVATAGEAGARVGGWWQQGWLQQRTRVQVWGRSG
jgi:hypothetical protein